MSVQPANPVDANRRDPAGLAFGREIFRVAIFRTEGPRVN